MTIQLTQTYNDIITTSLSRKSLFKVIDSIVNNPDTKEELYREIEIFVNSIGDRETLYNFRLNNTLLRFFNNNQKISDLAYSLRGTEDDFSYRHLFLQMKKFYSYFREDIRKTKVHLFFDLSAEEPDEYFSLGDILPDYKSIMCKFNLKNYIKYTDRNKTSAEGWTYQLSLLYLIVINRLYRLLERYIDDTKTFLMMCFININPIIVGFTFTLSYDLGTINTISLRYELKQLHASGEHLEITQGAKDYCVNFSYKLLQSSFNSSLDETYEAYYRGDNNRKRSINLLISGKGHILNLKISIWGLRAFDCITGYAVSKTYFDLIADENSLKYIGEDVFDTMMSHTLEHKSLQEYVEELVDREYSEGKYSSIFEDKNRIIRRERNNRVRQSAFKDLEAEKTLDTSKDLINNFNLQKMAMAYIIIATELAKLSKKKSQSVLNI